MKGIGNNTFSDFGKNIFGILNHLKSQNTAERRQDTKDVQETPIKTKDVKKGLTVPAKASFFFTLSSIISRMGALIFTPFFTRILTGEEYGIYSLFNTTVAVFLFFSTLEISGSVLWRGLQKFKYQRQTFLYNSLLFILIFFFVSAISYLIFLMAFPGSKLFPHQWIILVIYALTTSIINLALAYFKFLYKYKLSLAVSLIFGIIAPLLSLGLLRIFENSNINGAVIKIASYLLLSIPLSVSLFFYIIFKRHTKDAKNDSKDLKIERRCHMKFLLRLGLPMLPYHLSCLLLSGFDKLYIGAAIGKEAAGKYSLAYSLGMALSFVASGACQALTPWIMRKTAEGSFDEVKKISFVGIKLLSVAILISVSLAPYLLSILAPSSYLDSEKVIYPIALSAIPIFISTLNTSALLTRDHIASVIITSLSSAILNISLNLIFTKESNLISAALITLISYCLCALIGSVFLKKKLGKTLFYVNKTLLYFLFTVILTLILANISGFFIERLLFSCLMTVCICLTLIRNRYLFTENISKKHPYTIQGAKKY